MKHLFSLLSIIQAGIIVKRREIDVPRTRLNLEVLNLLYSEGFINGLSAASERPNQIRVFLKYFDNKSVLKQLKIVSVPSKHIYVTHKMIIKHLVNKGLFIISTSNHGLVLSDDFIKNYEILNCTGGLVLFQIIF